MKRVYAKAPGKVPKWCTYITPGKEYPIEETPRLFGPTSFEILHDDEGDKIYCKWEGCNHLGGGSWERIEREENDDET